jgi:hypothetical protein
MALQALREVAVGCLVDHLGKRLGNLLFRIVNVVQAVQQQVIHALDVFRKKSHLILQ